MLRLLDDARAEGSSISFAQRRSTGFRTIRKNIAHIYKLLRFKGTPFSYQVPVL